MHQTSPAAAAAKKRGEASAYAAITRLGLRNFRNYGEASFEAHTKHVAITGPNGIGKTNLLEAISLFSPGKGLRNAPAEEWHRNGSNGPVGLHLTLEDAAHITLQHNPGDKRKRLTYQDAPVTTQADMTEILSVVWLTPQMDGLFLEDAAARRKFFDRLIYAAHPEHAAHLQRYEHALRQRNKALKERASDAVIRAWNPLIVAEGVAIAAARLEKTRALNEAFATMRTPFPLPHLGWRGTVEQCLAESTALGTEELYAMQLETNLEQDRMLGQTRLGVHRSDVATRHRDKDIPVSQCSTGEQKALLTALVLAHASWLKQLEPQRPLIILLDDIVAHFDDKRREQLFRWIEELSAQVWMTGTNANDFASLQQAQVLELQNINR